ncbi:hypothetical protein NDU88_000515 [Pleurodeles waltl]|uniref:Integrase p58-like C-terminal domain-containing protein n=1 Tax=Pleurodeles waltl TaxID=8319 RepID=A0AAV7WIS9_PLEWA|nr:hypothetical protein NDU88_000515 [Pleurodeles waltl]
MDQVLPKARASRSKDLPTISPSTVDSNYEEEEFPPCAEPTPEELEADTAEILGEGGPAREELSVAQQTCPTLEGLRQQAVKQANGDVSDSHRVYWEDNLLYTEARDPKPGTARRSRMAEYMKKASKNLQASQELQKQWHDQNAVLVQYQPGQKVWVLEPVAPRALQDKWSGPHTIVEKKGEVTYLVDLGTARSPLRVLHVNRLKPYYDRADLTLLMATDEGQEEESDPLPDLFSSTEQDALVEGVVLADCLTAEQKDHCINLLGQFSELFSTVPGTTSWCEHTIDTGDSLPVKSKIYRQPDHVRDCIKQEVQKMLELGVVEHSESPWASPVVLVPKPHSKDGKKEMRFVLTTEVSTR